MHHQYTNAKDKVSYSHLLSVRLFVFLTYILIMVGMQKLNLTFAANQISKNNQQNPQQSFYYDFSYFHTAPPNETMIHRHGSNLYKSFYRNIEHYFISCSMLPDCMAGICFCIFSFDQSHHRI